jgi:dTDP-4-amino-4,6-dideoxygalactose transaminase
MLNGPFSPWPSFDREEKQAVLDVLDSNQVNYWTGQQGRDFETQFGQYVECQYAVAVCNGSVALDLAWKALALPKGSEVIVTSRTFIASISSIILAGLKPIFADIDRQTQNITADSIAPCITPNTKAILCVHLAGWPCEMDAIQTLAQEFNLAIVEDCAQAHGALYRGRPVGSLGDIAAWSFCQDKIMSTAGEGGMVTTNRKDLWDKVWSFKDHGKSWSTVYEQQHPLGFRWLHESFGTNWRMPEIQAVVGLQQLQKMPAWTAKRNVYARQILQLAGKFSGLRVPEIPDHIQHAFYKCYLYVEPTKLKAQWNRDKIMAAINQLKVPCFSGSCSEVYKEKAFDNTGFRPKTPLVNALELGESSLMFLVHPSLMQSEIDLTCQVLADVMEQASMQ